MDQKSLKIISSWFEQTKADLKAILKIEIFGQLKNTNDINSDGTQSMFVLTILEKWKRAKLTNTQFSKLKSAVRNKIVTALWITKKKFRDEELPRDLFLTTRQITKIRNVFS